MDVSIEAPSSLSSPGALCASNLIEMYLPKRELLWLRWVFALPSASSIGLDCTMRSLSVEPPPSCAAAAPERQVM